MNRSTSFEQIMLYKVLSGLCSGSMPGAAFLRAPLWPVACSMSFLFPRSGSFPGSAVAWREGECEGVCGAVAELEARVYSSPRDALRAPGSLVRNAAVPTPSDPCLMS